MSHHVHCEIWSFVVRWSSQKRSVFIFCEPVMRAVPKPFTRWPSASFNIGHRISKAFEILKRHIFSMLTRRICSSETCTLQPWPPHNSLGGPAWVELTSANRHGPILRSWEHQGTNQVTEIPLVISTYSWIPDNAADWWQRKGRSSCEG